MKKYYDILEGNDKKIIKFLSYTMVLNLNDVIFSDNKSFNHEEVEFYSLYVYYEMFRKISKDVDFVRDEQYFFNRVVTGNFIIKEKFNFLFTKFGE